MAVDLIFMVWFAPNDGVARCALFSAKLGSDPRLKPVLPLMSKIDFDGEAGAVRVSSGGSSVVMSPLPVSVELELIESVCIDFLSESLP